ncbi:hypothetical protein OG747_52530 (plasmid) [Streptomyces sp. NBC_01384]|uniref:hypothetical protein n=1 Tax=Streptomyces sp. NBC_01384 TaxID=2903847 RepID=UPI002F90D9D9
MGQVAAALVLQLPARPVLPVQVPEAFTVGLGEGLQLPYVAVLLLGTHALQDDREDLLRQVEVVAGVAGQGHEDPLGCLAYPVHLLLPHGVDRHGRAARWRARYG